MTLRNSSCPISKKISLKDFLDDFKEENVIECSYYSNDLNRICSDVVMLSTNEDMNNQIMNNCSLDNLMCENDRHLWDEIKIVKPREKTGKKQFKTYEYFKRAYFAHNSVTDFLIQTNRKPEVTKDLSFNNSREFGSQISDASGQMKLILNDIIVTVIICKPLPKNDQESLQSNDISFLNSELRIDILGSQSLEDLFNFFHCKNDESMLGDFSEIMDNWSNHVVYAKDVYKGGFFFIENTFYDIEDGEDMSSPIICWVSKEPERIAQFGLLDKKSMKGVQLIDLKICVGKPYLYQHLGDCEHFFVISDVRMVNKNDCQDRLLYPIVTGKTNYKLIKCLFCETSNSEWLVVNCKMTPTDKSPMCEYCLRMLLYDKNYKKIDDAGDFKVFRFPSFCN